MDDPRLEEIDQRINVIKDRIADERANFSDNSKTAVNYSNLISEFEGLIVDREYAETTYIAALAAYDSALTEAKRKSRYLASYIEPTLAEKPEYPDRQIATIMIALGLFLTWFASLLIFYSVKDKR